MKYIYLSGVVDPFWGEISQKTVADAVEAARADDPAAAITVVVNSPGGDVAEGLSVYNYLKRAKVNTEISGMAASIASVIALAGEHVAIYDNSTLFVHHAWAYLGDGNADDARTAADRMDAVDANLASVYASRGLSAEKITELMNGPDGKGSLITAAQALEIGLVDEILDPAKAVAACIAAFKSHPHHNPKHTNQEKSDMGTKNEINPAADPQAACGDPAKTDAAAAAAAPAQNEDGDGSGDDEDTRIKKLEEEIAELKKQIADQQNKAQQAAALKASVAQAHAQQAQTSADADLPFPELMKKYGYAKARMLYPEKMSAYCEAELAKGSIRD